MKKKIQKNIPHRGVEPRSPRSLRSVEDRLKARYASRYTSADVDGIRHDKMHIESVYLIKSSRHIR